MSEFGTSSLVAGALQVGVPSYGFRLVRKFGVQRAGWFLVMAFACLALLHFVEPLGYASNPQAIATWDAIYAIGSVLLLIGMGHIETLFSERETATGREGELRGRYSAQLQSERAELARANERLKEEISRRDAVEQALKMGEAQYRHLFMENPRPMWVFELRSGRVLAANKAALRQYGYNNEEFLKLTVREIFAPDCAGAFLKDTNRTCPALESRGAWKQCTKQGELLDIEVTALDMPFAGVPSRLVLADNTGDIERRETESRRLQNLDTAGRIAGGIGHCFGGLLAGIEGNISTIHQRGAESKLIEPLKQISAATTRASVITRQLLAAGGRQPVQLEPLDINGLVRSLHPVIHRLAGEQISAHNACGAAPLLIWADQRLVQQIILNLVLNACEAIPGSGTLNISTARTRLDESQARERHARPGDFIRLSIHDTGTGMDAETRSRLFEPFFTTKDPNKAAGLGLAGIYGAVRQQNGWIECTSEKGIGTEFRIFLPAAPTHAAREVQPPNGTVLLVEPDDRVRGLARAILDRQGYRVIEADCGALALMLWERQFSQVNLVLTEMDLPDEFTGTTLAAKFKEKKPDVKIVYVTNRERAMAESGHSSTTIITKPFTPASLLEELEQHLSS